MLQQYCDLFNNDNDEEVNTPYQNFNYFENLGFVLLSVLVRRTAANVRGRAII